MKFPVTIIGLGLFVAGSAILGQLCANYLRRASENTSLDSQEKTVLKYEVWVYLVPLLLFGWAVFFSHLARIEPNPVRFKIDMVAVLACFFGGAFLCYRFGTGKVTIFDGKLIYTEGGDRWEILANDVLRYSFNGLSFLVRKRSNRVTRVPATFQHSEFILAFLKQASVEK
jgi:hypothetical protein